MIGWLIYSAVDVEKNKYYIQMYKDKFKEHFIEIKLVIVEELENMEQYVKVIRLILQLTEVEITLWENSWNKKE